jgi:hypothetical protein
MTRSRPITFLAAAAAVALSALAAVGCGGDRATASPPPPRSTSGRATTVSVATGPHALPVPEGLGDEEFVPWRLRQRLAAAPGERQADGR